MTVCSKLQMKAMGRLAMQYLTKITWAFLKKRDYWLRYPTYSGKNEDFGLGNLSQNWPKWNMVKTYKLTLALRVINYADSNGVGNVSWFQVLTAINHK